MLAANSSIVISSPVISWPKINGLIHLLSEIQKKDVTVTVVTWEPDSYTFGDAATWMQMHEEMRRAGFYMKTVEEFCEHFILFSRWRHGKGD